MPLQGILLFQIYLNNFNLSSRIINYLDGEKLVMLIIE